MKYNSKTLPGSDYTVPMRDILPEVIGEVAKTSNQIGIECGRCLQTTSRLLGRLHKAGEVHIESWARGNSGPYVAHYRWGSGEDAERPAPLSNSAKHRNYRKTDKGRKTCRKCNARWRKTEKGQEYQSRYFKGLYARQKYQTGGVAAIDPLLAAMMGIKSTKQQDD